MKKLALLLLVCLTLVACKKDATKEVVETTTEKTEDGLTLLEGHFVYYADAAVLQTPSSIFGVILNDKATELAEKAKAYQKESTDMVKIRVRGLIEKKTGNEEGWDYNVNIKKIITIEALESKDNDVIKLEKQS